jgi:hypothetical protein
MACSARSARSAPPHPAPHDAHGIVGLEAVLSLDRNRAVGAGGYVITALLAGDARRDCPNYPVSSGGPVRAFGCRTGAGQVRA